MDAVNPEDTKNEIVSLAGRSFAIPMTPADSERRKQYFASLESRVKSAVQQNLQGVQNHKGQHQGLQNQQGGGGLLETEKEVLRAIGIDESLTLQLAPYLPNFFDTLPKCSSDPNMMLSKDCEDAYFVLWSTMYAAQHEAQKLFQENQVAHKYISDLDAATTSQIVKDIQHAHKEVLRFDPAQIQELFTRGMTPLYSEEERRMILSLFTR